MARPRWDKELVDRCRRVLARFAEIQRSCEGASLRRVVARSIPQRPSPSRPDCLSLYVPSAAAQRRQLRQVARLYGIDLTVVDDWTGEPCMDAMAASTQL